MHGMEPGKLPGRHSPNPRLFASPPHGKCKRERLDYRYNETPSSPLDRRAESTFRGVGTLRGLLEPIRQPVVHQQLWKQWRVRSTCEGYRRGRCLVDYRRSLVPGVRGAFFGEVSERWFDGDVGPNIRYTGRMGGDVEPSITQLQRGTAQKAVLAGTGYTKGELETIGVSKKGRIWSHRRERLDRFPGWCDEVGQKVTDASIDPDEIFKHCLLSKIVDQRPDKMPIAIDWPAEIYLEAERRWSLS